ncbi:MAG: VanZ family protein [Lachnospiraceae bacterium]|nr:VanZ family protein [Lachnospiraceae bacterium]
MNRRKWKYVGGILLLLYWGMVLVNLTLISRVRTDAPRMRLELFWCIKEAWMNHNADDWFFVVGNIMYFIPLGMILPLCFDGMQRWWRTTLMGLAISTGIETTQLVLHLGLFEFDDMFHNTLGTLMGYGVFVLFIRLIKKEWIGTRSQRAMMAGVWILVAVILIVALCMGQPVFDQILQVSSYL